MTTSEDSVTAGLVEISSRLGERMGYGAYYDSPVFMMHPYCWCDGPNCSWCGDEAAPNFHHKNSGFKVSWYKYIGRGMIIMNPNEADFVGILKECCDEINTTHDV